MNHDHAFHRCHSGFVKIDRKNINISLQTGISLSCPFQAKYNLIFLKLTPANTLEICIGVLN